MNNDHRKLADLHTHLYGCIDSSDFLDFLVHREVDWTAYQHNYQRVYGVRPPIAEILERCRRGVAGSRSAFHRLFVFGDNDCGNFDRFQAKYDMLMHGGDSARFSRGRCRCRSSSTAFAGSSTRPSRRNAAGTWATSNNG